MDATYETISSVVVAETTSQLARYGTPALEAVRCEAPSKGRWISASIGCSSPLARGALTILAEPTFWRVAAGTSMGPTPPDALLADFAGETVNVLMGSARNRLLALGLEILQATPTCAFGDAIVLADPGDARSFWHRFDTRAGVLHARLDALVDPEVRLHVESETAVQPCTMELVFF